MDIPISTKILFKVRQFFLLLPKTNIHTYIHSQVNATRLFAVFEGQYTLEFFITNKHKVVQSAGL